MSIETGNGWAAGTLGDMGTGPGFRKIRHALGVQELGVNAIVLPPRYSSRRHFHDEQEEVYFVHSGTLEFHFGDGAVQTLGPGGVVRVDAATVRHLHNPSDEEATYVCFGGKGGYVGRDGHSPPEG